MQDHPHLKQLAYLSCLLVLLLTELFLHPNQVQGQLIENQPIQLFPLSYHNYGCLNNLYHHPHKKKSFPQVYIFHKYYLVMMGKQ